jgi:hypothetical protein
MDSGGIIVEVDGSYSHIFLDCFHPGDIVLSISIENFRRLHFGSFSQEDGLWSLAYVILLVFLPQVTD